MSAIPQIVIPSFEYALGKVPLHHIEGNPTVSRLFLDTAPSGDVPSLSELTVRKIIESFGHQEKSFFNLLSEIFSLFSGSNEEKRKASHFLFLSAALHFNLSEGERGPLMAAMIAFFEEENREKFKGQAYLQIVQLIFSHLFVRAREFGYPGEGLTYSLESYSDAARYLFEKIDSGEVFAQLFGSLPQNKKEALNNCLRLLVNPIDNQKFQRAKTLLFSVLVDDLFLIQHILSFNRERPLPLGSYYVALLMACYRFNFLSVAFLFQLDEIQNLPNDFLIVLFLIAERGSDDFLLQIMELFRTHPGFEEKIFSLIQQTSDWEFLIRILGLQPEEPFDSRFFTPVVLAGLETDHADIIANAVVRFSRRNRIEERVKGRVEEILEEQFVADSQQAEGEMRVGPVLFPVAVVFSMILTYVWIIVAFTNHETALHE